MQENNFWVSEGISQTIIILFAGNYFIIIYLWESNARKNNLKSFEVIFSDIFHNFSSFWKIGNPIFWPQL